MQFELASTTEVDDFYYDAGVTRDVSGPANPVLGQTLCRFGHTTGASCADVYNLSVCSTVNGVQACKLVRMDRQRGEPGDSGGPWYWGNTAYGIHKGTVASVVGTDDVWTRVTYLEEALGVTVMR